LSSAPAPPRPPLRPALAGDPDDAETACEPASEVEAAVQPDVREAGMPQRPLQLEPPEVTLRQGRCPAREPAVVPLLVQVVAALHELALRVVLLHQEQVGAPPQTGH